MCKQVKDSIHPKGMRQRYFLPQDGKAEPARGAASSVAATGSAGIPPAVAGGMPEVVVLLLLPQGAVQEK